MQRTLGWRENSAAQLNDSNQVVGSSETSTGVPHAFIWSIADGMVDLGTLSGAVSSARRINDGGLVLGYSDDSRGPGWPFVWDPNKGMVALPMHYVTDLNNGSYAIGEHHFPGDGTYAVTWREDTGLIKLFPLEHGLLNAPMINDAGQVVYDQNYRSRWGQLKAWVGREWLGFQWFLWGARQGRISIEQYVPKRFREEFLPMALNNKGCIVGALVSKKGTRARPVLLEPIEENWSP